MNQKEATCIVNGYTGDIYYSCCRVLKEKGSVIKGSEDHDYATKLYVAATAEKDGIKIEVCNNCDYECVTILEYKGTATEAEKHVIVEDQFILVDEANCLHGEIRRYTCMTCGEKVEIEVGEPTDHKWMLQPEEKATCDKKGHSTYYECATLGCTAEKDKTETKALGHEDRNGDEKCDRCGGGLYKDGNNTKACNCICHKDNLLMKFICKIYTFFWKLLKIGHTCDCGTVHY